MYSTCQDCSAATIQIPNEIRKVKATYSSWTKGEQIQKHTEKRNKEKQKEKDPKKVKVKKVLRLFSVTDTLENIVQTFINSIPKLKLHIYTAHRQCSVHATSREKLTSDCVITIEDYQRNTEVEYIEKPASMAYSSNTLAVAVYPICVEYRNANGDLRKGVITFISDDKLHDLQQVRAFEKRMFDMLRNDLKLTINHWQRWSDGCSAQFKSQFVNADLRKAKNDFQSENASFCYFEAHKGKNTSDTIGLIINCAFLKDVAKENEGIGNAADVVRLLQEKTKTQTAKFDFFLVEEFPFIERIPDTDRASFR